MGALWKRFSAFTKGLRRIGARKWLLVIAIGAVVLFLFIFVSQRIEEAYQFWDSDEDRGAIAVAKDRFGETFSKPIYAQAARKMVETGGGVLSHPVGLAVHDDGRYRDGPLEPGHVFAVDPQLWVPEENLYLRYEDTIVVTEDGMENFTDFLPSELDDIEALVREKGVVQQAPPDQR